MSELKSVLFIAWLVHIFKILLFLTSHGDVWWKKYAEKAEAGGSGFESEFEFEDTLVYIQAYKLERWFIG